MNHAAACALDALANPSVFTERQLREIHYHEAHAARQSHLAVAPVSDDVIREPKRRWWNHYWATYDILLACDLRGKKVLVPGCGFGEDAIRIARMGASVYGIDICKHSLEIARHRARGAAGAGEVILQRIACESIDFPDNFFDAVFCVDILHHVDLQRCLSEIQRVAKPDPLLVVSEVYTHSILQWIRTSFLVTKVVYPWFVPIIYGKDVYITEDEHKLDQRDLAALRKSFSDLQFSYYYMAANRLFRNWNNTLTKIDRVLLAKVGGPIPSLLAGRVLAWRYPSGHDITSADVLDLGNNKVFNDNGASSC
jgi:ubiquinone/menaquinone biosynthesis C-methylase UbiE